MYIDTVEQTRQIESLDYAQRNITMQSIRHCMKTVIECMYQHHSYMSAVCVGVLSGFGLKGYEMAINYFSGLLN